MYITYLYLESFTSSKYHASNMKATQSLSSDYAHVDIKLNKVCETTI